MPSSEHTFRGWKLPLLAMACLIFSFSFLLKNLSAAVQVPVVTPPTAQYPNNIAGIGLIEPKSEVITIGTELSGIVRKVYVKVGDTVKAGDPLFTLDERDVSAQIKTLEALLESSRIQAEDAQSQFSLVKDVEDKRAIAKDDFNRRKYAALLGLSKVSEIQAQLGQAHVAKDRLTVRAPIDGTILSLNIRPGEFAMAGDGMEPMIRMGDVSTLHVRVEVDEENASRLSPSAVARGFMRGNVSTPIALKFVRYEPYIRPKQNLAGAGQRVDTHVLQAIYAIDQALATYYVGEQMDVFIDDAGQSSQ